jgi:hypothetical protein
MFTVTNRTKNVIFMAGVEIKPSNSASVSFIPDEFKKAIAANEITVTPSIQHTLGVNRLVNNTGVADPGVSVRDAASYANANDAAIAIEVARLRADFDNLIGVLRVKQVI